MRPIKLVLATAIAMSSIDVHAAPTVLDPNLQVQTVVGGLNQPISMAFLGANDMFVLEKATGQVQRVVNGVVQGTVLDLAVNSASERGLLGIALQPDFAISGGVYLYWTASSTGADTSAVPETPLLGNRVDRFVWNGSSLVFDRNIAQIRALQADAGQPPAGNHNGGPLRFGPDGNLYVMIGDVGRRGQLQNLPNGPTTGTTVVPDDQFGGPQPDNAHLTGAILRLNPDGTTPADNPFFAAGASIGGEVGANIQKLYSYGIRNSFGMAFDPVSGLLWMSENGDDAFDEINRVDAGMNGGWIQIMGPLERIEQYKEIETASGSLQQIRWPPSNIADTEAEALARLFELPGSQYSDPEFSWKFVVAPAALGFQDGDGLGTKYDGDMFVGASTPGLADGYLFRFDLNPTRTDLELVDAALADRVADNAGRNDGAESESLLFGTGFGVGTDIVTGPDGALYVVSLSDGAVYRISLLEVLAVPEPAGAALFFLGLAGLAAMRRTRP
jgi:glucose/arabinose dehydrogenase